MDWLSLKKQYKNLQRKEIGELKKTMRILKSEKVRRKELKERILETTTAKESVTVKHGTDDFKENTNIVVAPEGRTDETKICSKTLDIASGTVVLMKTASDKLTKKDIKVIPSFIIKV